MKTLTKRWLGRALLGVLVAGVLVLGLAIKPVRDTQADLRAIEDQEEADLAFIKASVVSAVFVQDDWVDCAVAARAVTRALNETRTRVGVAIAAIAVDSAISQGCTFDHADVGIARMLALFDERTPSLRWPMFAQRVMGLNLRTSEIRASISDRAVAECTGARVALLRSSGAPRNWPEIYAIGRVCESDS